MHARVCVHAHLFLLRGATTHPSSAPSLSPAPRPPVATRDLRSGRRRTIVRRGLGPCQLQDWQPGLHAKVLALQAAGNRSAVLLLLRLASQFRVQLAGGPRLPPWRIDSVETDLTDADSGVVDLTDDTKDEAEALAVAVW